MSNHSLFLSSRSSTGHFNNELANYSPIGYLKRSNSTAIGGSSSSTYFGDDDDEQLWFSDEQLASKVFPRFEEIRRMGKLCDVTLIVGDRHFSAHRIVLAATIPYFQAMFTNDMVESSQREISMQGIEPEVLEHLINFAYCGRVKITNQNVQSLLVGASFLQMQNICDGCCQFLQRGLQGSNVLTVRHFAGALGCNTLVQAADSFIQKHFNSVSKTDDFFQLPIEDVVAILSKDELYVNSEEQVFEVALSWVRKDVGKRKEDMSRLLSCVRLPLLKPQYITDCVASEELIKNCLKCRDLVDEAKDYHLMPERRPLLQTFRTKPRCCNDIPGYIYAVGGLTNNGDSLSTVERYDPVINRWTSMKPMSTLRSRVGVTVMHEKLYAIGGFNGHDRLRTVEMYDPESKSWREVAPLNNKRSALGAAVVGDKLFVCGGYDGITSLSTVECYDAQLDRWTLIGNMSKQRSAAGIAVLDGKIFVLGGHDGMSIFNSVECFDPESGRWTSLKPMINRRCRLGAATLNGKIFACGGYDGSQFLRSVERYDPDRDEWVMVSTMNVKRSRVALVSNCGKMFAVGGYDGISNLSSMEIYDPVDDVWRFGASLMAHEGGVGIGVIPIVPSTDI